MIDHLTFDDQMAVLAYQATIDFIVKTDILSKERLKWVRRQISDSITREEDSSTITLLVAMLDFCNHKIEA